jgi:predicted transcriptional regulator
MDETQIEKLACLSGRLASKVVSVLERRGYDIRGKMSALILSVPFRLSPRW